MRIEETDEGERKQIRKRREIRETGDMRIDET